MPACCPICRADLTSQPRERVGQYEFCPECRACLAKPAPDEPRSQPQPGSIELPDKFQVLDLGDQVTISWRWFSFTTVFLTVFALAWNGIMVAFATTAIGQNAWQLLLFGGVHMIVGLGMAYWALSGWLNRTVLHVDVNQVSIRYTPLPWPGQRQLDPVDITQLYCRQRVHRHKHGGVSYSYQLLARLRNGRDVTMARQLGQPEHAQALKQYLERWLGLTDQAAGDTQTQFMG